MRYVDLSNWPRRTHFQTFKAFDYPHFNLTAAVDLGLFYPAVKQRGRSFSIALVYVLARAANAIPEFRQRIRGEQVVEHEVVHPSFTVLVENDLFSFCSVSYEPDFAAFARRAREQIAYVKENLTLEDEPNQDNLLFMTGLPWISFTGVMHPIHMHPVDSVPRIAWGKFVQEERWIHMPLSVQGHHALMDGLHVGRYFEQVQALLNQPEYIL
jgi:chloramphenicol O-acetyltransferase type A